MNPVNEVACSICGEPRLDDERWFLVVEDRWQDKLQILHWDDQISALGKTHCVCSPAHLRQLVVHWMTTGSLDHPFARRTADVSRLNSKRRAGWTARNRSACSSPKPIGELTVHRESMRRVLSEQPQSLRTILDALLSGLQRETPRPGLKAAWDQKAAPPGLREM